MLFSPLAVLALSSLLIAEPADDPATLLPADTLIYFGSTSLHANWEASQNTAMARILAEPEVRSFLHQPLGAANSVIAAGLELIAGDISEAQAAAAEMGMTSDISLNSFELSLESVEPPVGQLFFGLTHIGMPGMNGNPLPDVGLTVGIELLDDGMVTQLKELWGSIPAESSQASHGGVDYLTKLIPETPMSVHLAFIGSLAVLSLSDTTINGMIDRHHDGGASLATSPSYQKMLSAAGGLLPGGSSSMIRMGAIADIARMGIAMGMSMDPNSSPEDQALALSVFDSIGLSAISMVGSVSAVGSDGLVYSTSVASVDENAPGLMAKLSRSGDAVDLSRLDGIPADCLSASVASIGTQAVDLYDFGWKLFKDNAPEEAEMAEQQMAAVLGGVDLRNDLLANITGTMTTFAKSGQGLMGAPDNIYSIGLRDSAKFVSALGSLLDTLSAQVGMPVSLKESVHDGAPYYEIDLSATPAGMMAQPAFAIRNGELILGTNSRGLKGYLTDGIGEAEALSSNERFMKFVNGMAANGAVEQFGFADLAETFGTSYGSLKGMAMMFPMGDEIPVDLAKLPPTDSIAQYLEQSYTGMYSAQGGLKVSRSVSQFQLTDFVPLALAAGVIYAGTQDPRLAPAAVEPTINPEDQAQTDLRELKASITVYKISSGSYPETLADLVVPLGTDFPQGAYPHGELPVDPWGNGYSFAMEMHPKKKRLMPKLWSFGPNGIDEAGAGDDVLKF